MQTAQKRATRTSSDCRIPWNETPGIHEKMCTLLNMSNEHFEPLKFTKYEQGQFFRWVVIH